MIETSGPKGIAKVNHTKGNFLPIATYDEFLNSEHYSEPVARSSKSEHPGEVDMFIGSRCLGLIDAAAKTGTMPDAHVKELRWRILTLSPYCEGTGWPQFESVKAE
ncbi:MAG: hypothetical protein AAGB14_04545 [Verrucomicrobiota bacterium]